jgi:hypothetical protein
MAPVNSPIHWRDRIDDALAEANRQQRFVLLDFFSPT